MVVVLRNGRAAQGLAASPAASRAAQVSTTAQVLAAELLTALLHAVPPPLGEALSSALAEPLLLCLQAAVGGTAAGVQPPLLALSCATLTLAPRADAISELLVPTCMLGISCTASADWSHWVRFALACLPLCTAAGRDAPTTALGTAPTAAEQLVNVLLTTLSDLLTSASTPLSLPQLEALLVALHHTLHFVLFGVLPPPIPAADPPPPPKPLPRALELAQLAMAHQMPTVLAALLDTWQAAGAADTYPVSYTHLTLPTIYSV